MKRAILFDFDGTLVNTNDIVIASFQHTYRYYKGHEEEVSKITSFFGEPLLVTMAREFPETSPEEAMETYRSFQYQHKDELVTVFDGIKSMLSELKARDLVLAIVTSRTTSSTVSYLEQFDMADYFDLIISCDDTAVHKPNPEPVLLAMEKLGADKSESLMIGDGDFDLGCAHNAGIEAALVGWHITENKVKPDYYTETPEDIVSLIDRLNSGL